MVALNVNGHPVALEQSAYADVDNLLLVPQGQTQVRVTGPRIRLLPDSGLIELTFYDITTATDSAGNPSRRETFRWYFDYAIRGSITTRVVPAHDVRLHTPDCR
jgi:hypothetical protein